MEAPTSPPAGKRRPRLRAGLRGICRDQNGTTAIEFAFIAPAFLMLLFSFLEIGFLFTRMAMVDHAVGSMAKSVYTGGVTKGVIGGTTTQADLETAVCEQATIIADCTKDVTVELTEVTSLSSLPETDATCTDSSLGDVKPAVNFQPGAAQSTVFMRVCVTVDLLTPGLGFGMNLIGFGKTLAKTDTGRYQIVASVAFKNEPF